MSVRTLPEETARAIATRGRSAVEEVLDWIEPPHTVSFSTSEVPAILGGLEPELTESEQGELEQLRRWFRSEGRDLHLSKDEGHWTAASPPLEGVVGSAPYAIGKTPLDAAERLAEQYVADRV
jgi:hypothetical protein